MNIKAPQKSVSFEFMKEELPPELAKKAKKLNLKPKAVVSITIQETDESITKRLLETLDRAGKEADKNGINDLTDEEFEALVNEK